MSIDRLIASARAATPAAEGWPPAVVVGHIGDVDEQVWLPRLEQMVAARANGEACPSFPWWEPDAAQTLARHGHLRVDEAGANATGTRIRFVTRVRDLSPQDWTAQADHEAYGRIDVAGLLFAVLTHDEEHRGSLVQ
jgi:hypothetical protein